MGLVRRSFFLDQKAGPLMLFPVLFSHLLVLFVSLAQLFQLPLLLLQVFLNVLDLGIGNANIILQPVYLRLLLVVFVLTLTYLPLQLLPLVLLLLDPSLDSLLLFLGLVDFV